MYDISQLNVQELNELEKKIKELKKLKIENDGYFYKSSLRDERIFKLFEKRFPVNEFGCENPKSLTYPNGPTWSEATDCAVDNVDKAMLKLCDLALENYKMISTPKHFEGYLVPKMNGSVVMIKPELYREMHKELCDVFMKYAEIKEN